MLLVMMTFELEKNTENQAMDYKLYCQWKREKLFVSYIVSSITFSFPFFKWIIMYNTYVFFFHFSFKKSFFLLALFLCVLIDLTHQNLPFKVQYTKSICYP